jgi:hypothetical protein
VPGSLSVQKNAGLTGCEVDFTTKPNQFGSFRFRVRVKDSGSNAGSNKAWSLRKWVTITVNPVNDPPYVESVTAETQTVQYSDDIDQVTILVRDIDSPFGDLSLAKSGEPTDLDSASLVQTILCGEWDSEFTGKGSECTWTLDGQVTVPGDKDYIITFDPDDGDALTAGVTGTHTLTVVPEEAAVYLDNEGTANPVSAPVVEGGDKNQEFTMFFWAFEMNTVPFFDEADEGNANSVDSDFVDPNVKGYISFKAVGPGGSPPRIPCTSFEDVEGDGQYGDYMVFECIIPEGTLEVNTYEVLAEVDGEEACTDSDPCRYFYGFDEDAFVVYDPDAGFTTGGGWFYFPDTEVAADACLEYECAEFDSTECLVYNEVCLVDDPCADYPGDKTNFGFTMKYNKKGTNVQGSALVMRHTKVPVEIETGVWACLEDGNYRVKSNVLYGLALSESEEPPFGYASFAGKATYREPDFDYGGNHTFFIYVEDYGDQGCNQGEEANDRFWIELWDKDDNVVLMPTMGDDAAVEAEAIECGNIVVPFESGGGGGGHGKGKNK